LKILPCLGKNNISKQPKFQVLTNIFHRITIKETIKIKMSINSSKMAKIFRTLNRKKRNSKYNKKISCHFLFEQKCLVENVVYNILIL
jgi:hypothetical protein